MNLTPRQRRILLSMSEDTLGFAAFTGESARKYGFRIVPAELGGIIVYCYGTPAHFLKARGLI